MSVKPIPDGYHTVTPYLVVNDVLKQIDFLKAAFGASTKEAVGEGAVTHAEVQIGNSMVMMGMARGENKPQPCSIYLYVEDTDAMYKTAIEAGATSIMEPADQFYGDRNAGVKDLHGNQWWIGTRKENLSPEELAKRAKEAHSA